MDAAGGGELGVGGGVVGEGGWGCSGRIKRWFGGVPGRAKMQVGGMLEMHGCNAPASSFRQTKMLGLLW